MQQPGSRSAGQSVEAEVARPIMPRSEPTPGTSSVRGLLGPHKLACT